MNDKAIGIIANYIDNELYKIYSFPNRRKIKNQAYARSAAYELINRLDTNAYTPALDVIDDFIFEMVMYASMGDGEPSYIFQQAAATGELIKDLIEQ